jgi:hypothetical protein
MTTRIKRRMTAWLAAFVIAVVGAAVPAPAQDEAPIIKPATFQKILKFLDKIGGKETFPAPLAQDLGLSDDPKFDLPITVLVTNDHKVYFCRSNLDPQDYIVWLRWPDNLSSYMFLTHADFKPVRALLLQTNAFPQQEDLNSPKIRAIYKEALAALAKDVNASPAP